MDSTLARLTHRKGTLPQNETLDELSDRRKAADSARVSVQTRVSDLAREQKKADGEVELVRARRVRDQQRMDSGQITSPKDLESMQHEIVALDRRISTLEDEELEVMEQLESAQSELDRILGDLSETDTALAQAQTARDEAVTVIDAEARDAVSERAEIAQKVPDTLIALYDKLRAQQGGVGAAALRQRRCEGCRLELNGADLRELAARPGDEVLRCPECDRILVRTAESGL